MRRCLGCGLFYNSPRLNDDELRKLYDINYYIFRRSDRVCFERTVAMYYNAILPIKHKLTCAKILEIGCARGHFLAVLAYLGWNVQGIEISEQAAKYAKNTLDLNVFVGTIEEFTATDKATFPLVMALDVLEHVSNPAEFLATAAKTVDKDGYLIIGTPNGADSGISEDRSEWPGFNPFHVFVFSPEHIIKLLEKNGFSVEQVITWGDINRRRKRVRKLLYKVGVLNLASRVYKTLTLPCRIWENVLSKPPQYYISSAVEKIRRNDGDIVSRGAAEPPRRLKGQSNMVVFARKTTPQ